MNEEPILDPRDTIVARQAVEIEQLKREFNSMIDQFDKLNRLVSQMKQLGTRFMRF